MEVVPTEDFEEIKKREEDLQNDVEEHHKNARESLQNYRHFKERCNKHGAKLLSLSHQVVLLKDIKSFRTPSLCY